MEKTKINLSEIEIKDLDNVVVKISGICTKISNKIFLGADTIPVSDISRTLYSGESAEVTLDELTEIITIVEKDDYYKPFVHLQIMAYLNEKLNNLINKKPCQE